MDKLIQLCFRSIIWHVEGTKIIAKDYEELAMEEYRDIKCITSVEDYIPKNIKRKLYEMVS